MPFEDDLLLFLGIETVCEVKFFNHVQFGDAVFHSCFSLFQLLRYRLFISFPLVRQL